MLSPRISAHVSSPMNSRPMSEGLRQSVGAGLHGIAEIDSPALAVAQQFNKPRAYLAGVEMMRMSRSPASISVLSG